MVVQRDGDGYGVCGEEGGGACVEGGVGAGAVAVAEMGWVEGRRCAGVGVDDDVVTAATINTAPLPPRRDEAGGTARRRGLNRGTSTQHCALAFLRQRHVNSSIP